MFIMKQAYHKTILTLNYSDYEIKFLLTDTILGVTLYPEVALDKQISISIINEVLFKDVKFLKHVSPEC